MTSLTPDEWKRLAKGRVAKAKKPKYGNQKAESEYPGYSFSSQLERDLFSFLKGLEAAGEIRELKVQASVYLTRARILYKPDFKAIDSDGKTVYFEAKGFETDVWRIKRRLFIEYGDGKLEIYRRRGSGITLAETITPACALQKTPDTCG